MTEILSNLLGQYVEFERLNTARGMVGMVWAVYDTSRAGPALVVEIVDTGYSSYHEVGDLAITTVAEGGHPRLVNQCSKCLAKGVNAAWLSRGEMTEHVRTCTA